LFYLKNRTQAKEVLLTESVDPQLLGGFVLKYGSRIIDGSLKSSLSDLAHNLKA
jgi:F0F1-type ATP synthase delta subunit